MISGDDVLTSDDELAAMLASGDEISATLVLDEEQDVEI